jgi:hypothetical protein
MDDTNEPSQPRTRTLNGVTFVRRSNLGPITVHSSGSAEDTKPFDSLIPLEQAEAIMEKYLENLKENAQAFVDSQQKGKQ